jgi:hypothetical protein
METLSLIYRAINSTLFVFIFSASLYGQATPDELGRMVFASFQAKDITKLDTLFPTASQIITISKERGLNTSEVTLSENFEEVYEHHLQKFKDKCLKFINDTTYFKVDWPSSTFDKSIVTEKEVNLTPDSSQNSKKVKVHMLDIHFSDKGHSFVISFRNIYNHRGIWKISNNVKFKKKEDE